MSGASGKCRGGRGAGSIPGRGRPPGGTAALSLLAWGNPMDRAAWQAALSMGFPRQKTGGLCRPSSSLLIGNPMDGTAPGLLCPWGFPPSKDWSGLPCPPRGSSPQGWNPRLFPPPPATASARSNSAKRVLGKYLQNEVIYHERRAYKRPVCCYTLDGL